MKIAEDFRRISREALDGKWSIAIMAGLVASILGGISFGGPEFKRNLNGSEQSVNLHFAGKDIFSSGLNDFRLNGVIFSLFGIIFVVALVMALVYLTLGSFVGVGYAKFNLNLVDRQNASFENLFAYFTYWRTTTVTRLLRGVYVLLWSLLFIVPGIMAVFSYIMTDFILAENPELSASEAIEQSKNMMYGNRWRLFCLQFSFIGWDILAALTLGIGNLWLNPYKYAAYAAFYREISGTEFFADSECEPEIN